MTTTTELIKTELSKSSIDVAEFDKVQREFNSLKSRMDSQNFTLTDGVLATLSVRNYLEKVNQRPVKGYRLGRLINGL